MSLTVRLLGTAASRPTVERNVSSVVVVREGETLMFDCGEGTQRQMMRYGTSFALADIFFTHTHTDHVLGVIGLTRTLQLQGRTDPLRIWGPKGSARVLRQWSGFGGERLGYPVEIAELEPGASVKRKDYSIVAFPVDHRGASAVGYALVEDLRRGRFNPDLARELGVPEGPMWGELHRGRAVTLPDGRVVEPGTLVGPTRAGRRIVITGDTAPVDTVRVLSEGADVLVHEATFSEDERQRAAETLHTTARQAGELAAAADVRLLALTHFSPRYFGPELLEEALAVFPRAVAPRDFDVIEVPFAERGEPRLVRRGARPPRNDVPSELPGAVS